MGEDAVALGRKSGMDYALFLYAEDSFASTGRVALQVLGIAGCAVGFCAPNIGGGGQFAYASLVDLGPAKWCGSTSSRPGPRSPGSTSATSASPRARRNMVERLLNRMKPGRDIRRQMKARS